MFNIGPHTIPGSCVLAPMAGITDRPFRQLCRDMGAALATSEMVTSDIALWTSKKSQSRINFTGEKSPIAIQIAGSDPQMLAEAAQACEAVGAHIIDINMGCPAKKVCNKAAGSALMKDTPLVERILKNVVASTHLPVTLKIRTGWNLNCKNATTIARIAEQSGIKALTVHGRTRACRFNGSVEYDTIAEVVDSVEIPVIANGDITSPEKAKQVLTYTGAAALMIGRAAQGNPWLFGRINSYLCHNVDPGPPSLPETARVVVQHLEALYAFYGDEHGCRIARKHLSWYLAKQTNTKHEAEASALRKVCNTTTSKKQQIDAVRDFYEQLYQSEDKAA